MRRQPPRSTPLYSSAASDVYKRQGRYESLQKDFNSLCKKINKPTVKLSSEKKLKGKPHYSKFYNTNSIKTIERLYKDDIEYFNYEF